MTWTETRTPPSVQVFFSLFSSNQSHAKSKRTNLSTEPLETADEHGGAGEPTHALSAVHGQLTRVKILVDLAIGNHVRALLLGYSL